MVDVVAALRDLADRGEELVVGRLLEHVALRADRERVPDVARVVLHREREDVRVRRRLEDLGDRVDPAAARHDDVEEDHVGLVETREPHRVVRRAGLVLDLEVLLRLEQAAESRADELVVVDDEETDRTERHLRDDGRAGAGP